MKQKGFWKGVLAALVLFCLGATAPMVWGPRVAGTLYTVGSQNPAQVSEPSSDTLKIVLDPADEQTSWKKLDIYAGDHATNPVWRFRSDGDVMDMLAYSDAGAVLFQMGESTSWAGNSGGSALIPYPGAQQANVAAGSNAITTPASIVLAAVMPSVRFGESSDPDEEEAQWSLVMGSGYTGGTLYVDVWFCCTDTSGTITANAYMDRKGPGENVQTYSPDSVNTQTCSPSSTSNGETSLTITLTNSDGVVANDQFNFKVNASFNGGEVVDLTNFQFRE